MTRVRKIRNNSSRNIDLTKSCKEINRDRELNHRRYRFHRANHLEHPDLMRCSFCQNQARYQSSRKGYYETVWKLTELYYQKHFNEINPTGIVRGSLFHLDHIYSISKGFAQKVPAKVIASHHNLRLIEKQANLSKGDRCDITLDELKRRIQNK